MVTGQTLNAASLRENVGHIRQMLSDRNNNPLSVDEYSDASVYLGSKRVGRRVVKVDLVVRRSKGESLSVRAVSARSYP